MTFEARGRVAVETGPECHTDFTISGPLAPGLLSAKLAVYHDRRRRLVHERL